MNSRTRMVQTPYLSAGLDAPADAAGGSGSAPRAATQCSPQPLMEPTMNTLPYLTLDKDVRQLALADARGLAAQISGGVLDAAAADYDGARKIWNATIDRHPALIARCLNAADVQAAVRFAAARRMLTSVRGGGHHIAGNAVAEGGLMIDLSAMREVAIDPSRRVARVGAGALLGDVDRAAQAHGLATPLGINSTTGVAGLTLGGGFGWLSRRYGLTVDNLLAATLVTADGAVRRVSADTEPDLYWALRGGGGNFGVVTEFEFRLHPVGPEVYAGLIAYPLAQAREVLRGWRDFNTDSSEELSVWAVLRKAPPLPFLPSSAHGEPVAVLALVHSGTLADGEHAAAPLLRLGTPLGSALGPTPYAGFQTAFDPLLGAGARNYWKSHNFSRLSDATLDIAIGALGELPDPQSEIFIGQLGGAASRVRADATAYLARDARYVMNLHGRWADPRDDERVRQWARRVFAQLTPHAIGGGYVNFLTEDEAERVAASYGANYPRLQALKRRYDPDNLFRMNLNIAPAAHASP
jgi:FAD/FMN-containing dehydrogenase